jgi:tRNA threonylcarbamoyl adenosine modification protein YjeE
MTAVMRLAVDDPEAMESLGGALAARLRAGDLVILRGELGAGKTTLTRGIGVGLGVRGAVTSPTFVLARTHPRAEGDGAPLVHVDAYRLGDARELDDLDLDWPNSISVVEWGDGLLDGVADAWLRISIDRPRGAPVGDDDLDAAAVRTVAIEPFGPRWDRPDALAGLVDAHEGIRTMQEPA